MDPNSLATLIKGLDEHIVDARDVASFETMPISGIEYDSRSVQAGSLFVCIKGVVADGHDFAQDALSQGASVLAVERRLSLDVPQIVFDDTRLALALLARNYFSDPSRDLVISAVTGTNGKTTTSYLIEWISRFVLARQKGLSIEEARVLTGLIGTVETRVGTCVLPSKHTTPESSDLQALLAQMRDAGVSHVSMEASSHAIALDRVTGVRCSVAAFTNLTQDHLDFHGSMNQYFEAKAALFDSELVAKRVINIDGEYGKKLAERCKRKGHAVVTCGFAADAQLRVERVEYGAENTSLLLVTPEGTFPLVYPLIGSYNVDNVLLAAGVASCLGFAFSDIVEALSLSPQIPGRMERVWAKNTQRTDSLQASGANMQDVQAQPAVFVDYSHTPDSIEKALAALNALKTDNVLIVFGCGGDRDRAKRPLMGKAALHADYVVVTSDNPRSEDPLAIIDDIVQGMIGYEDHFAVEPDRRAAIARAINKAHPGDFVLIAGKGHEDYQIVGDTVLDFDDRLVASEELSKLAELHRTAKDA